MLKVVMPCACVCGACVCVVRVCMVRVYVLCVCTQRVCAHSSYLRTLTEPRNNDA